MPDIVSYPFDPTGQATTNRIIGEQTIILAPGDRLFHYTMLTFGPFFEEGLSLKIRDLNNNVIPLVKGVDYYLSHKFMDASLATMHPVFGSISFLRRDIVGTLLTDYNTLGGIWTIDTAKITEILMNTTQNPRITTWEQVVERPVDFPVIDHPWNLDDMVGQKELLEVFENFYTAYLNSLDPSQGGGMAIILAHINNQANPHNVTAGQTGAYSISQMDQMLLSYVRTDGVAGDTSKFNGMTFAQATATILGGKAADSDKLGGQTLEEIIATIHQQVGDADTLGGKSLTQIMADVKALKVDRSTATDLADDSSQLGGKSLQQILSELGAVQPDLAKNSLKVFGLGQQELLASIDKSNTFTGETVTILGAAVIAANTGGTQDAAYRYLLLGSFPLPIVDPNDTVPVYDTTQRNWSTSVDLSFIYENKQTRASCEFTMGANQIGDVVINADGSFVTAGGAAALPFYVGAVKGPDVLALDGVTKGWRTDVYAKFRIDSNLTEVGIFQQSKGSFVADNSNPIKLYDRTLLALNSVVWRTPVVNVDQAAIDGIADFIETLLVAPAA